MHASSPFLKKAVSLIHIQFCLPRSRSALSVIIIPPPTSLAAMMMLLKIASLQVSISDSICKMSMEQFIEVGFGSDDATCLVFAGR